MQESLGTMETRALKILTKEDIQKISQILSPPGERVEEYTEISRVFAISSSTK